MPPGSVRVGRIGWVESYRPPGRSGADMEVPKGSSRQVGVCGRVMSRCLSATQMLAPEGTPHYLLRHKMDVISREGVRRGIFEG